MMHTEKSLTIIAGIVLGVLFVSGMAQAATAKVKCVIVNGTRAKVQLEGEELTPGSVYSGTIRNKTTLTKRFRNVEKPATEFGQITFKYDNEVVPGKTVLPPNYTKVGDTIRGVVKFVAPGSGEESLVAAASTTCVAKSSGGSGGGDDGSNHQ